MGLDITAYSQLTQIHNPDLDADGYPVSQGHWLPGGSMEWSESLWPGRAEGIIARAVYAYGATFRFRAGSYSGYGHWRKQLAAFIGIGDLDAFWRTPQPGPFTELLNFADNEGVIGPVVSAKLARDFAAHQAAADQHPDPLFRARYADWRKAFELAADGGAVDFH